MRLLDKLRDALFEEEVEEDVAKQVDVEKTIKKDDTRVKKSRVKENYEEFDIKDEDNFIKPFDFSEEEKSNKPAIFEDEDFLSDTREIEFKEIPKKEEKILYKGNYEMKLEERTKEKFKLSPIISPVYGVLEKNYTIDKTNKNDVKEFSNFHIDRNLDKKEEIDFDTVRQKAFGIEEEKQEEDEDNLLYEMQTDEATPKINKVTLGDAEEYYDDLGLEYNVDYKVKGQEKSEPKELMTNFFDETKDDKNEAEEKNLYDLIDLMYDGKDK